MPILVKTIGIIIACYAAILFFSPETARKIMGKVKEQSKLLFGAAALRIVLGGLLFVAGFSCAIRGVVIAIGVLTVAGGVLVFALGSARSIAFIDWWLAKSDSVIRMMAIVALAFGAALVFAA